MYLVCGSMGTVEIGFFFSFLIPHGKEATASKTKLYNRKAHFQNDTTKSIYKILFYMNRVKREPSLATLVN